MFEKSLKINFILNHLKYGPIILLTNARLLNCDICNTNNKLRKCIYLSGSYQGHYIVICGHDSKLEMVYYRNPAYKDSKYIHLFNY